MSRSVVALIPISGGDPEFSGDQITYLHSRPLIEYTIRAAQESRLLDRVIVLTDSKQIAESCRSYGVEVPFLRPPELANPSAPITEVLRYALGWLEAKENYSPDWAAILLVTYPFRPKRFVDHFIQTVLSQDLDSAFAAVEERHSHWLLRERNQPELVAFGSETAKAQKRPFFRELSGLMSMAKREVILSGSLYGQKLGIIPTQDMWAVINVHDPIGQQLAELLAPQFLLSK